MRDTNLIFNSNATISANGPSAILDMGKWASKGVWVTLAHYGVVGGAPATAAELTAYLEYSDSATFAGQNAARGPDIVRGQNTAGFTRSVLCQSRRRYARIQYVVAGTTPSFTGIYAHVTSGPQRDDTAGVNTY